MKKRVIVAFMAILLSSCASFNKTAGYPKDKANVNTDWRTRIL